ncbi:MAG TPA: S41 family peptidase [Phycisphaerae bacterium]|nr:S41 family peptidase [Phycisphaerae bacterium]
MSRTRWILLAILVATLPFALSQSCTPAPPTPDGNGNSDGNGSSNGNGNGGTVDPAAAQTLAAFDELWTTFDRNYSYFNHKGIDWNDVRTRYRPNFNQALTPAAFAERVAEMLQELHDWHVWVQAPGQDALGYEGTVTTNFPPTLMASYTHDGSDYQNLANVIYHAWLDDNIAYIAIDTFSGGAWQSITDDDIESLFDTYALADGLIIDIRNNNGGSEINARRIASHLALSDVTYGFTRDKVADTTDHEAFNDPISHDLEPSSGTLYLGPVACLIGQRCMSSAEWFTLMMRGVGATLVGDQTRGASGNPRDYTIASNGVQYGLSTWIAYTADNDEIGFAIEDVGVTPDVPIQPGQGSGASYDDRHDFVLEAAIEELLQP